MVVSRSRSRTKIPRAGLHLSGERFHASDVKATRRPSADSEGCEEAPNAGAPPLARETSSRAARREVVDVDAGVLVAGAAGGEGDPRAGGRGDGSDGRGRAAADHAPPPATSHHHVGPCV